MKIIILILCSGFIDSLTFGQSKNDSTKAGLGTNNGKFSSNSIQSSGGIDSLTHKIDSTSVETLHTVSSIHSQFQSQADSLQLSYQKPINKLDSVSRGLRHKIDSLQSLRLPNEQLTSTLVGICVVQQEQVGLVGTLVGICDP